MEEAELCELLNQLLSKSSEDECLEFKLDNEDPAEIGEYISALANSAFLKNEEAGYVVWGIEDNTWAIKGSKFNPLNKKIHNESFIMWLNKKLLPKPIFNFNCFKYNTNNIVILRVEPSTSSPVKFNNFAYIRIGNNKTRLDNYPELEKKIWLKYSQNKFEESIVLDNIEIEELFHKLDVNSYYNLMNENILPNSETIKKFINARYIIKQSNSKYQITALGAILLARNLEEFSELSRKELRVILYNGNNKLETIKERIINKGYASSFNEALTTIFDLIPTQEKLIKGLRTNGQIYPEIAIRELLANALIHQDFLIKGSGVMVEIFNDRIEITNPGKPLIDDLRFIDEAPQSRNESLAKHMRLMGICEERGSGIDKVIYSAEQAHLPAPEFISREQSTTSILFAKERIGDLTKTDRIRACYQHACLLYVQRNQMTNSSLRNRLNISEKNSAVVSRIIKDTISAGLIKPFDMLNSSKKHTQYIPFWGK